MLNKSAALRIVQIMKESANRALQLRIKKHPRPYYCSFLLRDSESYEIWSSEGSLFRNDYSHTRDVYCDLRVGSYRQDQTREGGLYDNSREADSYNFVGVPVDNSDLTGLKVGLWKLSEHKFKEALTQYNQKEGEKIQRRVEHSNLRSFSKLPPVHSLKFNRKASFAPQTWINYTKKLSKWIAQLPEVISSWAEIRVTRETKIFSSTEEREILAQNEIFALEVVIRGLSETGEYLQQELILNRSSTAELPPLTEVKQILRQKHKELLSQLRGLKLHAFAGPALLMAKPAGLLFHEAIGHRLEGNRFLSRSEGQTFKGKEGQQIFKLPITFRDNPTLKEFKGVECFGGYEFDDEGCEAQDTVLIDKGFLKTFLTTRAQIPGKNHIPNGHARNQSFQRPISRMGVSIIEAENATKDISELRKELIREIERQNCDFGIIVYDTSAGETDTSNYDFQAFAGEVKTAS